MTRGQMIFIFLMICTAVMTGATLGVISNLDVIAQNAELISASADAPPALSSDERAATPESKSLSPTTVADYEGVSRSTQLMVITAQEKDEIRKMLQQLGMAEDEQESDFILAFQRSNNLTATGNLDSQTLNLMIKQATYNKASRAASTVVGR